MKPYYEHAGITIYHGDCREVLAGLGAVDAVVTDPPYAIEEEFGEIRTAEHGKRRLQFDWDGPGVRAQVIEGLSAAIALCAPRSALFVWTGFDSAESYATVARVAGFTVKPACWVKTCPPPAGKGNWWPSAFEIGYYGYRRPRYFGDENPKRCNVWRYDSYRYGQPDKQQHPTQKPLGMTISHVSAIVPPDGTCIDPFLGSGTTLVAAKLCNRKAIGIELEEKYCEIAAQRLQQEVFQWTP